jgi:RNA polymerase sigma-70 factor, ECF subfamily
LTKPETIHRSDHAVVRAVVAGDTALFEELVRRYEPVARSVVVAILRDTHLAQDVLQETFLRAYTHLGKLADGSRFGPWVLKIARREALRTRRNRRMVSVSLDPDQCPAAAENNGRLDEDSLELLDALARLPEHEQVAIVLHYFEQHKVETIAQITGRTTGTVTKQLSRARRRLDQWLRKADQ